MEAGPTSKRKGTTCHAPNEVFQGKDAHRSTAPEDPPRQLRGCLRLAVQISRKDFIAHRTQSRMLALVECSVAVRPSVPLWLKPMPLYRKLTRCLRCLIEIDGDCLQPREKAARPGLAASYMRSRHEYSLSGRGIFPQYRQESRHCDCRFGALKPWRMGSRWDRLASRLWPLGRSISTSKGVPVGPLVAREFVRGRMESSRVVGLKSSRDFLGPLGMTGWERRPGSGGMTAK